MTEAKVVKDLAEVCASGAETYSAWTTAKAIVQRRYLSPKAHGTFEDCGKLLVSLARVLRTYLRIDLAQELLRDVIFPVMEHFSAKQAAGAMAAGAKDSGASDSSFDLDADNVLQHVFDTLISATTRTYMLMGPVPVLVEWNKDANSGGVDAVVAQSKNAASWAEDVVLEFAIRAAGFLSQLPESAGALSRWAENLFVSYEQLLSLRGALLSSPFSTPKNGCAISATVTSPLMPVPTLAAQLLRMSVLSHTSRTGTASSDSTGAATTPVTAAVYWLTHFALEPNAVNQLFAQYVYFDILGRGLQKSSPTSATQGKSGAPAKVPREGLGVALEEKCALTRREAIFMARAAVEAYWKAFPLLLQRTSSAKAQQLASCVEDSGNKDANLDSQYVHLYRWTWFLDSLTLTFAYEGRANACANKDAAAQQRERQKHVCAQLLEIYADVAAELPGLNWKELATAYIGA
ncbi:hypothetical protein, unknown function [Leishmania tarentolae]|uniref:Uncharacterized protein n=1 Tax=Leishmania tarentolae TaxID=5689 RepID=A0A640KU60_LEITA|nr:hypothetical protein, unknown function [Leishmania tarentolae]